MTDRENKALLTKLQWIALIVGGVGVALCAIGAAVNLSQMLQSYLFGFVVFWSIAVGCLGVTMITHLVQSNWGKASRPYFAAGIGTLPLLAVLFIPVALGVGNIYDWADSEVIAHIKSANQSHDEKPVNKEQASENKVDENGDKHDYDDKAAIAHVVQNKVAYLNPRAFWIRAAIYFVIWLALGILLSRRTVVYRTQIVGEDASKLRYVCGLGLGVVIMTVSFASVDWIMSLEPAWYSTIYGALIAAAGVVAAMSLVILAMGKLGVEFTGVEKSKSSMIADLGSLLMGFVLIWTYFAFSQYLIIWSGDQPSEAFWYLERTGNGWEWIAIMIVVFHFAAPFLLLLSRENKRNVGRMTKLVLMLVVVHAVDLFWNIKPAFSKEISVHWLDLAALAAVGGLWVACGIWQLKRQIAPKPAVATQ